MRHNLPLVELTLTAENENSGKVQISLYHVHIFKNANKLMSSTISVLTSC